ncbi:MAG: V-type ATPase subunit [Treponema sp.]|nr:V-type ATPase subunit [Treponema sp.]
MAMDKSAASSYVYAKASGMLAKSFVGSRSVRLFEVKTLAELWSLIFTEPLPIVPEMLLAKELEKAARERFVSQYMKLVSCYSKPADILLSQIHHYDYENIKAVGAALCLGDEKARPSLVDVSPFNYLKYNAWPDVAAMTAGSPLSWYDKVPLLSEQRDMDFRLDWQYVSETWQAACRCDPACREDVKSLLSERFMIEGTLWALRLRKYYDMPAELLSAMIRSPAKSDDGTQAFSQAAEKTLSWALDDWQAWNKWKYSQFLNPHEEGVVWNIDPRWIYNAFKKDYVKKTYSLFHRYPFTECPLFCWYIIKRNELDNIRAASESLRLGIPSVQAMQTVGVQEVNNG